MPVTLKDSIEIYSRMLIKRYGSSAVRKAEKHADELKHRGDIEGFEVWIKISETISGYLNQQTNLTNHLNQKKSDSEI
jgi:hypothetical protein